MSEASLRNDQRLAPYWHAGGEILHRYGGPHGFQTEYLTDAQAKERFEWFAKEALDFHSRGDRDAAKFCARQAIAIQEARVKAEKHRLASGPYQFRHHNSKQGA